MNLNHHNHLFQINSKIKFNNNLRCLYKIIRCQIISINKTLWCNLCHTRAPNIIKIINNNNNTNNSILICNHNINLNNRWIKMLITLILRIWWPNHKVPPNNKIKTKVKIQIHFKIWISKILQFLFLQHLVDWN